MNTTTELQPINVLRLFETTKDERSIFVTQIIERFESGEADPLETHLQIKCMEEVVKQVTGNEKYKDYVLTAAQKEGKSFAFHNAKFETKEVGTKYDFSKCGDLEYTILLEQLEKYKEAVKAKETFLKTLPGAGMEVLQGDELVKVYPPAKSSTTSVCVTLK